MSSLSNLQNVVTDTWMKASWEDFLALADDSTYADGRFYYHPGYLRIEMSAIGPLHGRQNSIVSKVVSLFATLNHIRIVDANTSFRKARIGEFQPDLSFYIGSEFREPPQTNSPIDLNEFEPFGFAVPYGGASAEGGFPSAGNWRWKPSFRAVSPPTLVVEIASTSLSDDLGRKAVTL